MIPFPSFRQFVNINPTCLHLVADTIILLVQRCGKGLIFYRSSALIFMKVYVDYLIISATQDEMDPLNQNFFSFGGGYNKC